MLSVQLQRDEPVLYVRVPISEPVLEARDVLAMLTGDTFGSDNTTYLGTLMFNGGGFVRHYFGIN
jgi:hypothetical protein